MAVLTHLAKVRVVGCMQSQYYYNHGYTNLAAPNHNDHELLSSYSSFSIVLAPTEDAGQKATEDAEDDQKAKDTNDESINDIYVLHPSLSSHASSSVPHNDPQVLTGGRIFPSLGTSTTTTKGQEAPACPETVDADGEESLSGQVGTGGVRPPSSIGTLTSDQASYRSTKPAAAAVQVPLLPSVAYDLLENSLYRDFSHVHESEVYSHTPSFAETFPQKLHLILSEDSYDDCVCWLSHGRAWRILQPLAFEERVLKNHFNHSNFSSFKRQVNGWCFKRITHGVDEGAYYHEVSTRYY